MNRLSFVVGMVLPGLIVTWLAGFLIRRWAPSWGLVDRPGGHKTHVAPTPLGGGLAIAGGIVISQMSATLWLPGGTWPLWAAAGGMFLLGLVDDVRGVAWHWRLAIETLVALALVFGRGWQLTMFLDWPLLTAVLTVLWIVGLVNSFNMLDNMDGLSAGVAAVITASLIVLLLTTPTTAERQTQRFVAGVALSLAGALLGFLPHNWPPARLFMGDSGSYLVGFLIAISTVLATFAGGGRSHLAIFAPLCLLLVPIYDTVSVVLLRLAAGQSPFAADHRHVSHRLVALGLSRPQAVAVVVAATALSGVMAIALVHADDTAAAAILAAALIAVVGAAIVETVAHRRRKSI